MTFTEVLEEFESCLVASFENHKKPKVVDATKSQENKTTWVRTTVNWSQTKPNREHEKSQEITEMYRLFLDFCLRACGVYLVLSSL